MCNFSNIEVSSPYGGCRKNDVNLYDQACLSILHLQLLKWTDNAVTYYSPKDSGKLLGFTLWMTCLPSDHLDSWVGTDWRNAA
jgi:hypothetical protein